jgi:6-phosphogluconolactonase
MKIEDVIQSYDERRDIAIPGDRDATILFSVEHFIEIANRAIEKNGKFTVALSGGTTPAAIFRLLAKEENRNRVNWSKVLFFWSDERAVPPYDRENNYHMAMESGLTSLPIDPKQIFRMEAEEHIEENAMKYEHLIQEKVPNESFDLMMLGMGEDGHTASLFPQTHGLHSGNRLVVANYVPEKKCWRMSMTFKCINDARHIVIYAMGKGKAHMLEKALSGPYNPDIIPIQRVGTPAHKALWILDADIISDFLPT